MQGQASGTAKEENIIDSQPTLIEKQGVQSSHECEQGLWRPKLRA